MKHPTLSKHEKDSTISRQPTKQISQRKSITSSQQTQTDSGEILTYRGEGSICLYSNMPVSKRGAQLALCSVTSHEILSLSYIQLDGGFVLPYLSGLGPSTTTQGRYHTAGTDAVASHKHGFSEHV